MSGRYGRHLLIEGFAQDSLERIRSSRVFVAGAGGLGSAVLPGLVASGVGEVVFADFDIVEVSNLHRQVIYREEDAGRAKAAAATQRLCGLNSDCKLLSHELKISADTLGQIFSESYDLVFDCTDNFTTRYLLADYCWEHGYPVCSGAIVGMDGQVMSFVPSSDNPCLRCLMPRPPEVERRSAEFGVFGPAVAVIGALQATEGLKLLAGFGRGLEQKMISYDAAAARFVQLTRKKSPDCPFCSK